MSHDCQVKLLTKRRRHRRTMSRLLSLRLANKHLIRLLLSAGSKVLCIYNNRNIHEDVFVGAQIKLELHLNKLRPSFSPPSVAPGCSRGAKKKVINN